MLVSCRKMSIASSSEYVSCDDIPEISSLDRAEVGREENKRLYGPRANVQVQTDMTGGRPDNQKWA